MKKQIIKKVLFIQGAGDVGYEGDEKLVSSLRIALGTDYNNGVVDGNNDGNYGNEVYGNETNGTETNDTQNNNCVNGNGKDNFQAFGQMRLGLNYVLAKRFISTIETGYQLPFNNLSNSNGGLLARVGFAYQFGKNKK